MKWLFCGICIHSWILCIRQILVCDVYVLVAITRIYSNISDLILRFITIRQLFLGLFMLLSMWFGCVFLLAKTLKQLVHFVTVWHWSRYFKVTFVHFESRCCVKLPWLHLLLRSITHLLGQRFVSLNLFELIATGFYCVFGGQK